MDTLQLRPKPFLTGNKIDLNHANQQLLYVRLMEIQHLHKKGGG